MKKLRINDSFRKAAVFESEFLSNQYANWSKERSLNKFIRKNRDKIDRYIRSVESAGKDVGDLF